MDTVDHILDGLEQELLLERELGVRTIEFDRGLLMTEEIAASPKVAPVMAEPKAAPPPVPEVQTESKTPSQSHEFIFIHDRPLSPRGTEMITKIVIALGKTPETAPVISDKPIPKAKVFVFLGKPALNKFMPGQRCAINQWGRSPKGKPYLLVPSPEEILRYKVVTPAVDAMKRAMWGAIKLIHQHLREDAQ